MFYGFLKQSQRLLESKLKRVGYGCLKLLVQSIFQWSHGDGRQFQLSPVQANFPTSLCQGLEGGELQDGVRSNPRNQMLQRTQDFRVKLKFCPQVPLRAIL